ncbi:hypothetical protein NHX12_028201, partial [Muraenolepis orangiensis]
PHCAIRVEPPSGDPWPRRLLPDSRFPGESVPGRTRIPGVSPRESVQRYQTSRGPGEPLLSWSGPEPSEGAQSMELHHLEGGHLDPALTASD